MIRVGDTISGYEILSKLSAGGMATLYLARRGGASGFSKHVAIKVVHEHLAEDPTFVEMFVDEALLSSRIHHPNVVHIEELRQLDGQHFLVMEYVSGVSLSQLVKRLSILGRRMTPQMAVYIAVQVADGLHAAHELKDANGRLEGLVHRDVSPQNVLLAWEGHVKLIDFGVAKARSRMQQTTRASLKGKLRYMAPEQARGKDVDRRSDTYALAIVLWEMLTMRRRFGGDNDFAVLDEVLAPEHVAPSQYNPAVSPELDAVVLKALAPAPEDRYVSAQEFRRALAGAVPSALALDASHLSELVRAACAEALGQDRQHMPNSMVLPGGISPGGDIERAPLRTMTVSASQVLEFADSSSGDKSFVPGPPEPTVSHLAQPRPSGPPRVPPPGPVIGPPPVPPPGPRVSGPSPVPALDLGTGTAPLVPELDLKTSGSFVAPVGPPASHGTRRLVIGWTIFGLLLLAASVYVLFPPRAADHPPQPGEGPVANVPALHDAGAHASPTARPDAGHASTAIVGPGRDPGLTRFDAGVRRPPPHPTRPEPSPAVDRYRRPTLRHGHRRGFRIRSPGASAPEQ